MMKNVNGNIELDPFNEEDREWIMSWIKQQYPAAYDNLVSVYNACWEAFNKDHPGYTKPPVFALAYDGTYGSLLRNDNPNSDDPFVICLQDDLIIGMNNKELIDTIYHEFCHMKNAKHTFRFWEDFQQYSDINRYKNAQKFLNRKNGTSMKNFARVSNVLIDLTDMLSIIDGISIGGLTKQGYMYDTEAPQGSKVYKTLPEGIVEPDDVVTQTPAFTEEHLFGQCDSIAALIAVRCDKLGWKHYDFITECDNKSLWEVSHFFVMIQTPLGFIRGDMSVDYMKENGLFKFSPTLEEALDLYCDWAKKTWNCKKIILHPYNASDEKYYGMDFNTQMFEIIGAKKVTQNFSRVNQYDPPMSVDDIKTNYPKLSKNLLSDPVHKWRAETGIELIHKEPSLNELIRIWKNWNLMSDDMKQLSDRKSFELFGVNNTVHFHELILEQINDDLNNLNYIDDLSNNYSNYHIKNYQALKSNGGGICWDFTAAEAEILKDCGIKCQAYFVIPRGHDGKLTGNTHSFVVCNGTWIESSWGGHKGVHKINSYKDVVTLILAEQGFEKALVIKYDPIKTIGMDFFEFADYLAEVSKNPDVFKYFC